MRDVMLRSASNHLQRLNMNRGFTLIETIVILTIVLIGIGLFVPAVVTIMQIQRTQDSVRDFDVIYRAIVGNPARDTYGYMGDVGDYPTTLLDLVTSAAIGWRGPYVTDVELESNILLDRFGGGIEYFNETSPTGGADCLTMVSKGPDLTSTNLAVDPNIARACVMAPGPLATTTPYSSDPDNQDNIAVPDFISDVTLLDYDPIGSLNYEIFHDDQNPSVGALVPGCPAFNTITLTSATRGTADEFSLTFNPGTSIALVQGVYDLMITPASGSAVIWREQVAIPPVSNVTKSINLSLDSSVTPTYTLEVTNANGPGGNRIRVNEFGVNQGVCRVNETQPCVYPGISGCAPIIVEERISNVWQIIDQFTMPFLDNLTGPPTVFAKTYPQPLTTVCITNVDDQQLIVYEQGLVLGTVPRFGSSKTTCFAGVDSSVITCTKQDGTPAVSTCP